MSLTTKLNAYMESTTPIKHT